MTVDEVAASLNSQLESDEVFSGHREVIFVCHSLGGIIVQQLLLTHREYAKQVPLIYFFATPQTGASLSRLGNVFSSDPLLEALLPGENNHYLESLEFSWKGAHFKIARYCAYEKKPYKGFVIVDRLSGTRNCDEELPINEDHVGIVKPNNANHPSYVALRNAIRKLPIPKRALRRAKTEKSAKTAAEQLRQEQLKQEGMESFNTLAGSVTVGSSGDVLHSMFTITNDGKVAVRARAVYCVVHMLILGSSNMIGPGRTSVMTSGPITIEPGGDAESEACLAIIGAPVSFVGCADIGLTVDYTLQDQPEIGQSKVFRFVTHKENDGLHWYRKPAESQASYCFDRIFQSPYGNAAPQLSPPPSKALKGPS